MDTTKNMVFIKGEIKTPEIRHCGYDEETQKVIIEFSNGREYGYTPSNVLWLKDPTSLNPGAYRISRAGRLLFNINAIYVFKHTETAYWHICFSNGRERDYLENELTIVESCLEQKHSRDVFEYIKSIAKISDLKNEETGEKILERRFSAISFIGNDLALAKYLNPQFYKEENKTEYTPIFPFGCNNSQYKAVRNAMENQISVIQGPPGTGKTQTILNIIANILMQGQTVQIVSNNNSATENVFEKLSSLKYNLGFIVAALGSSKNKKAFVEQQDGTYPKFADWKLREDKDSLWENVCEKSDLLKNVFENQEKLSRLKQEQAQLVTEYTHFRNYAESTDLKKDEVKYRKGISADKWVKIWQEYQSKLEKERGLGVLFKMKTFLEYGIRISELYERDMMGLLVFFQEKYYETRQTELKEEIEQVEKFLSETDPNLLNDLSNESMTLLKGMLAEKYKEKIHRPVFMESDLRNNSQDFLDEYPVVLSTTFSSRSSLDSSTIFDYVIMDEASQVDVATGALALSCAKNAVIVGDTKQLPNVVTDEARTKSQEIFDSCQVDSGYLFTNSFLQSVLEVMPDVKQTLLREHYRCHPKIINFCNQKFYRGELVIMTSDNGEKDVLKVIKTVPGNHARNHYSQRQIDVIRQEVLPIYADEKKDIGIIAPYRNQVEAIGRDIDGIDAATVHKFQGKEKDTIIISTVDDEISDFADDPYLINVAVSRAKKRLAVIVTGNPQHQERNILDLVEYIQYNNFEVVDSKVYSVFDYLYRQYDTERTRYLKNHRAVSRHDSENLMYSLICEVLSKDKYSSIGVLVHYPLNMLVKSAEGFSEREYKYAMNPATHVDFLLYNRVSKKAVLGIEVDGYEFHKEDTVQSRRDSIKNHIFELCELPLLRFKTNGSGERQRLIDVLDNL